MKTVYWTNVLILWIFRKFTYELNNRVSIIPIPKDWQKYKTLMMHGFQSWRSNPSHLWSGKKNTQNARGYIFCTSKESVACSRCFSASKLIADCMIYSRMISQINKTHYIETCLILKYYVTRKWTCKVATVFENLVMKACEGRRGKVPHILTSIIDGVARKSGICAWIIHNFY
jgi:hypothetical protein